MKTNTEIPGKWCIKVTEENREEVGNWFNENRQNKEETNKDFTESWLNKRYLHYPKYSKYFHSNSKIIVGYTEISIEQFREITNPKERRIFGYKLRNEFKYLEAIACKIAFDDSIEKESRTFNKNYTDKLKDFDTNSLCFDNLKKAGVLDLWFEPVYEEGKYDGSKTKMAEIDEHFCWKNPPQSLTDLSGTKIFIGKNNPILSAKVQQKSISLGWIPKLSNELFVGDLYAIGIYFNENKVTSFTREESGSNFKRKPYKEIFPADLGIELESKNIHSNIKERADKVFGIGFLPELKKELKTIYDKNISALGFVRSTEIDGITIYEKENREQFFLTEYGLQPMLDEKRIKEDDFTLSDMQNCFNESRLTNPILGFRHKTFNDYMKSEHDKLILDLIEETPQKTLVDMLAESLGYEELPNHQWHNPKNGKIYRETKHGLRKVK